MSAYPTDVLNHVEEPDSARLERALHWDSEGHWPWRCIGVSAALHASLVLPSFVVALFVVDQARPAPPKEAVTQIFVPAPSAPQQPPDVPESGLLKSRWTFAPCS